MESEYTLIDSHKLVYHREWVKKWHSAQNNWELAKTIYPIYIEISPAGQCNHRCPWCAADYIGYKNRLLDPGRFRFILEGMTNRRRGGEEWNGVKSIMFAGEGEPTLHPKLAQMIGDTKRANIDVALTTNGTKMNAEFIDEALPYITWIKISLDAASASVHALNHHTTLEQFATAVQDPAYALKLGTELTARFKGEFRRILQNIEYACQQNRKRGLNCMIGAQLLMNPTNIGEVYKFAKLMKGVGCDYCVIKPYSQGLYSINRQENILGPDFHYDDFLHLGGKLKELSGPNYNVVFRSKAMQSHEDQNRHCPICQAVPMAWGYIMTTGEFSSCGCGAFLPQDVDAGDRRFVLGDINKQSFQEIWESERRRENWEFVRNRLDISECRKNCRMDAINRFLGSIKDIEPDDLESALPTFRQLPRNVNFI
jgi:MoaA/NifB/PqqE/SkfB family radical SAM enzyme